ncbi:Fic family protein [bacterium]|nr:Fic family protein [bacterium]
MKYIWQIKNWHDFKYDAGAVLKPLGELRIMQGKLLGRVAELGIGLSVDAQASILVEETVRTAEIEGQQLSRAAVRSSVAVKLGLPRGVGKPDRNADGLVDILLDAVRSYDQRLTQDRLNGWHAALFPTGYAGMRKIRVGKLRGNEPMQIVSGPMGKEKVHYEALPQERLDREMRCFLKWWQTSADHMDGILRAAQAHLHFLTIHPYEDGNGRLARAMTDMALAQDEKIKVRYYSVSSEIVRRRNDYYQMLENIQNCRDDVTAWYLWFIQCIQSSIEQSREMITGVLLRHDFWNKHAQTLITDRQKKVINRILEAGPGNFEGGLTTRKYVNIAGVSRATAFREITDLVDKNILQRLSGSGRNVHYDLIWPRLDAK